jgi:hypothetical protein
MLILMLKERCEACPNAQVADEQVLRYVDLPWPFILVAGLLGFNIPELVNVR